MKIELREPASAGCLLVLILFVLIGWGGAWVILSGLGEVPLSEGWFGVFVSLPLGMFVGGYSAALLLQHVLHRLFPSQLEGDSDFLHVRIFRTWNGLLSGFRKSNARLARDDVVGVSFGEAQGGHSQLFLAHRDGYDCYAGFTGTREQAESYGREILRWLNASGPAPNKAVAAVGRTSS